MITHFLRPTLKEIEYDGIDIDEIWFQQVSATCRTSRDTCSLLREIFPKRLISFRGGNREVRGHGNLDFSLLGYAR